MKKIILLLLGLVLLSSFVLAVGTVGIGNKLGTITDLSATDSGDFFSTAELDAVTFSPNNNLVYIGGAAPLSVSNFGYYNITSNSITNLGAVDTSNWVAGNNIFGLTYNSNNGLIYLIGAGAIFGYYNRTSNVATTLMASDTGNWMGTTTFNAITYSSTSNLIYVAGATGKFGVYNPSTGVTSNLTTSLITTIQALTYDSTNNLIYLAGSSGKFAVYNITSNTTSDLSATDTGNWFGTSILYGLTYDPTNKVVYIVGAAGKFGVYNISTNVATDLTATDPGDWIDTTPSSDIFGVNFDTNNNIIYLAIENGKLGAYNISIGTTTDLSLRDSGDWIGALNDVQAVSQDTTNNLTYMAIQGGKVGAYSSTNITTIFYNYQPNISVYTKIIGTLDKCWYNYNGTNTTPATCADINGITFPQGNTTITIYANETTLGTLSSDSFSFYVDTQETPNITYPISGSLLSITTPINVTIDYKEAYVNNCWYSNNSGATNVSMSSCGNITNYNLTYGTNTITVWLNDTLGRQSSSAIIFTNDIYPLITQNSPVVSGIYNTQPTFNCSAINASRVNIRVSNPTITNGLVSYFDFEETGGTKLYDYMNFNNGTLSSTGITQNVNGNFSKGYSFNGVTSQISMGSTYSNFGYTNNFTVCFWAKPASVPTGNYFIISNTISTTNRFHIYFSTSQRFIAITYNNTNYSATVLNRNLINIGQWYHVCYIKNNNIINSLGTIYINGVNDTNTTSSATGSVVIGTKIGGRSDGSAGAMFNGTLDDFAMYNRVLNSSEILKIYNDGITGKGIITRYSDSSGINGDYTYIDSLINGTYNYTCKAIRSSSNYFTETSKQSFLLNDSIGSNDAYFTSNTTQAGTYYSPQNWIYAQLDSALNPAVGTGTIYLFDSIGNLINSNSGNLPLSYNFTSLSDNFYILNATGTTQNIGISILNNIATPEINITTPTTLTGSYSQNWIYGNFVYANSNNATVYLYNSSFELVNSQTTTNGVLSYNFTSLANGVYYLNATTFGNYSTSASTTTQTITLDTINPSIVFISPTTTTGAYSRNWIYGKLNITDTNSINVTISLYDNTYSLVSSSFNTSKNSSKNFTSLANGVYYLNATTYDTAGNINSSTTQTITLDTINPTIDFITPTTDTGYYNQTWIYGNISSIDTNFANITINLYYSNRSLKSSSTGTNVNYGFNFTSLSYGVYYLNATATDLANNKNYTTTKNISLYSNINDSLKLVIKNKMNGTTTNLSSKISSIFGSSSDNLYALTFSSNNNLIYGAGSNLNSFYYNKTSNLATEITFLGRSTNNLYALTFSSNNNLIYYGGVIDAAYGYYNKSRNAATDLTATDPGDWIGSDDIQALTYTSVNNLIYLVGVSGIFGYYNKTSDITETLMASDTGNWMGTTTFNAITYNSFNDLIYIGGKGGNFGVYNRTSGVTSDLSATDTGNWMGTTQINALAYDSYNNLIYIGGDNVLFGVYDITTNVATSLMATDIGNWMGPTNEVQSLTYDSTNKLLYITTTGGGFGVYDKTLNVAIDLSSSAINDWIGTSNIYSSTFSSNNNLVYLGASSRKFGYYNNSAYTTNFSSMPTITLYSDSYETSCWYNWNGTNVSMASCSSEITNFNKGYTNLTVYSTNQFGVTLSDTYNFYYMTPLASISVVSPTSGSYLNTNTTNINMNFFVSEKDTCWYKINSGSTIIIPTCENLTNIGLIDGANTIYIYENDTYGRIQSNTSTVTVDRVPPRLNVTYPLNKTYVNNTSPIINITFSDTYSGLNSCWYSNNNGTTNITISPCGNIVNYSAFPGINNLFVWANDSVGNINNTFVTFLIQPTPTIEFISPTTFSGEYHQDYIYGKINKSNISNVTFNLYNANLSLINNSVVTTSYYECFQETANVSTTCGGLGSGIYSSSGSWYSPEYGWGFPTGAIDGNWSTRSSGDDECSGGGDLYINYTIPSNSLSSSLWQVAMGGNDENPPTPINLSLSSCSFSNILQLKFHAGGGCQDVSYAYCLNSSSEWNLLYSSTNAIFEEAMYWNISNSYDETFSSLPFGKYYLSAYSMDLSNVISYATTQEIILSPNTCTYPGSDSWIIQVRDNCTLATQTINAPIIVNGTGGLLTINGTVLAKNLSYTPSTFDGNFKVQVLPGNTFSVVK